MKKTDLLHTTVDHYDIKTVNVVPMIDMMEKTAFQARNLARAAKIVDEMVADNDCGIILTLAGSLISAGQKGIILDMMRTNMVDAIVSTGANSAIVPNTIPSTPRSAISHQFRTRTVLSSFKSTIGGIDAWARLPAVVVIMSHSCRSMRSVSLQRRGGRRVDDRQ